jgi:hypothetical protein
MILDLLPSSAAAHCEPRGLAGAHRNSAMEATQRSRRLRALAAGLGTSRRSARSCCCDRIAAVDGAAAAGAAARPPATAGAADSDAREQLLDLGYCVVPDVLSPDLLRRLRAVTDEFLDAQPREDSLRHRSQGSMIPVPGRDAEAPVDPVFLELLTWQPALDALVALGFPRGGATFTDGYVISKPPRSPPLFWHYDWFSWELSEDWAPRGAQYFLMYYLHSTTPDNGCLRAIPGSHFRHNELRDSLLAPHNPEYSSAEDLSSPGFAQRPDEVDVPVDAADLLIGDARMLHATHPGRLSGSILGGSCAKNIAEIPSKMPPQKFQTQKTPYSRGPSEGLF